MRGIAEKVVERGSPVPRDQAASDRVVIERVLRGERCQFEVLVRRYNQRLYRAARSILGSEHEAEDVVQDSWGRVFAHLRQFRGSAAFATWATRIAAHEALRRRARRVEIPLVDPLSDVVESPSRGPEGAVSDAELRRLLEASIDQLSDEFRAVFVLREIEGLSTAETAHCLDLPSETVKTRLHRARRQLRRRLEADLGDEVNDVFTFGGERCDRVVAAVLLHIG